MLSASDLPNDVLHLIFEDLAETARSALINATVTSRTWRVIALPCLLSCVDLSYHNGPHPPLRALSVLHPQLLKLYTGSEDAELRERQRAFVRFLLGNPGLAPSVRDLRWTLVWAAEEEFDEWDLRTWEAFELMRNVTRLDLAADHWNGVLEYPRQNPTALFPGVTELSLGGWMHRGLVKAIVGSIDASRLVSLKLNHLQDEGACRTGEPLPLDIVEEAYPPEQYQDLYLDEGISDDLFERQENGEAGYFPGPMWYPLRLLRREPLDSLKHIDIELCYVSRILDRRNDITMSREVADIIARTSKTLQTISIHLGEHPQILGETSNRPQSNFDPRRQRTLRELCSDTVSAFLYRVLPLLTDAELPHLERFDLKGYRILRPANSAYAADRPEPGLTLQYLQRCSFVSDDTSSGEEACLDYHAPFEGYSSHVEDIPEEEWEKAKRILIDT